MPTQQTMIDESKHKAEVMRGQRFEFGKNWSRFLSNVDAKRIQAAEDSLKRMLATETLSGLGFLDIGSGSGLFSLAAHRLGAHVRSFDYDPQSVACTKEMRRRFASNADHWQIESGSVLDRTFMQSLGQFDIVYSWGVLHHTGQMWQALENAHQLVAPGGKLFIAIYGDQGTRTVRWRHAKRIYNQLPAMLRSPFALIVSLPAECKAIVRACLTGKFGEYVDYQKQPGNTRGMSRWRDIIDWVGGYPYEVATPDQIFDFYRERGFELTKLHCGGVGLGCNEYVFQRKSSR
jgi:2-polyprenyl-3-methyl-5-hydroxy-6-metoxy-1,4-benzoquinol methylase